MKISVVKKYTIDDPTADQNGFLAYVDLADNTVQFMDISLAVDEFLAYMEQAEHIKQILIQEGMVHG